MESLRILLERCMNVAPQEPKIADIVQKYDITGLITLMRKGVKSDTLVEFSQVIIPISSLLEELRECKHAGNLRGSFIEVKTVSVADFLLNQMETRFSPTQLYSCLWYTLIAIQQKITQALVDHLQQQEHLASQNATAGRC